MKCQLLKFIFTVLLNKAIDLNSSALKALELRVQYLKSRKEASKTSRRTAV